LSYSILFFSVILCRVPLYYITSHFLRRLILLLTLFDIILPYFIKHQLSEARARLANTKGKKAKRKARERQLEESRRLSMLQKRRELKAAGVESKLVGVKKRKYIDYAREIPFQQLVPSGFYDVGDERVASKAITIDPRVQGLELSKMEGRHQKEEEDKEKQRDKKRLKTLFKANAPLAVMNLSENNDPSTLRRRSTLSLPAPQGDHSPLLLRLPLPLFSLRLPFLRPPSLPFPHYFPLCYKCFYFYQLFLYSLY
jgi:hypothetical protein